jgi:hypothetical protein
MSFSFIETIFSHQISRLYIKYCSHLRQSHDRHDDTTDMKLKEKCTTIYSGHHAHVKFMPKICHLVQSY